MQAAKRVVFNTGILYVRIVISTVISLFSVPLVLRALGSSDYGVYSLVAGVVAMLSFLNASMTVASQRYLSVAMGRSDDRETDAVYNTSFVLHFVMGLGVVAVFEICSLFIFRGLNIPPDRIPAAKVIYQFLVITTFMHFISVPFDAMMNAKEDMLPYSVIGVAESVLMLLLALSLRRIEADKLVFYGLGIAAISVISFLLRYAWNSHAYKAYSIAPQRHRHDHKLRAMTDFAGWNLLGGLATVGRNQGVAIVINLFLGTVANAAYGIANQINGAMSQFSSTFQKAINPQLMKSEGMNDRERMLRMAFLSSKFSVLALSFFAVPLILEMDGVLSVWLGGNVPQFTLRLSQLVLLLSIVSQYSAGVMSAVQAGGNIRAYQLTMSAILLLNVPIAYFLLKAGHPVYYTTACFVVMEAISLLLRLLMSRRLVGLSIGSFVRLVVSPTVSVISISLIPALAVHLLMQPGIGRILAVGGLYCTVFVISSWLLALEEHQRQKVLRWVGEKLGR